MSRCHTNYFQEKDLTVKCVLIGASDNLYSPVTRISLCTSSLIHFCVPADNVNNKELHLYIKENRNKATVIAVSIVAILFVQMITRGITSQLKVTFLPFHFTEFRFRKLTFRFLYTTKFRLKFVDRPKFDCSIYWFSM